MQSNKFNVYIDYLYQMYVEYAKLLYYEINIIYDNDWTDRSQMQ